MPMVNDVDKRINEIDKYLDKAYDYDNLHEWKAKFSEYLISEGIPSQVAIEFSCDLYMRPLSDGNAEAVVQAINGYKEIHDFFGPWVKKYSKN